MNVATQKIPLVIPKGLTLYPFQKKDIQFYLRKNGGYCMNEMGTGKSIIAAVWLAHIEATKALIIVPAIMRPTIAAEIRKWSKRKWKIQIDDDTDADRFGRKLPHPNTDCFIISYRYLVKKNQMARLRKIYDFDCVIADEWHYCKEFKAKRTKMALLLMLTAKFKLALSGTPYNRNVGDLYSQLIPWAREKDIGKNFTDFGYKYMNLVDTGYGREFQGLKNEEELQRSYKRFARRRLLAEVVKELPKFVMKKIYVNIPESLAKRSLRYVDHIVEVVTGQREYVDPELADYVSTIKRQIGVSKCRATIEYTLYALESKEQLVLYLYHKDVIEIVKKALREKNVSVRSISGRTPGKKKESYIRAFQKNKFRVLILQIKSAIGITLTSACYGIAGEIDYSWSNMDQAFKRLHRISQKNNVQVDVLVARKSIDGHIFAAMRRKKNEAGRVLGDK